MRNKLGIILMLLGAALVLGAAALFFLNRWEDARAGIRAEAVLPQLEERIRQGVELPQPPAEDVPLDPEAMAEMEIDGTYYVGSIAIPALKKKLPVISHWSYPDLKTAPCRYTGSPLTDDLVIMAHNYDHHFGQLQSLQPGDLVAVTDLLGTVHRYEVVFTETLEPTDIASMTAGDYHLTLFTCTYGGQYRVTVRCNRI